MRQDGTALLSFTVKVSVEDRGDYWAAYMEPPGMTVYGDTESAVMGRAIQAMDSFQNEFASGSDGLRQIRAYLDAHNVPSSVATDAVQDDAAPRVQYPAVAHIQRPMDFPLGVAAGV